MRSNALTLHSPCVPYDPAGNLTYDGIYAYTYDAWNRLVKVTKAYRDSSGTLQTGSVLQTAAYDGLSRRIVRSVANSGSLDAACHFYYQGQQLIETRNGSDFVCSQQVWGLQYIDELVQIGHTQTGGSIANRRFYPLQDANYNVLGVVNHAGHLIERYEYTPYGQRTVYTHGYLPYDIDGDGDVDNVDIGTATGNYTGSGGSGMTFAEGDVDGDGDIDNMDIGMITGSFGDSLTGADDPLITYPALMSFRDDLSANPTALCEFGFQGKAHDEPIDLIHYPARPLHSRLGRWISRDPHPAVYPDGLNAYAAYHVMRGALDPLGLAMVLSLDQDSDRSGGVLFRGLAYGWAAREIVLAGKTAVRLGGSEFYIAGRPQSGMWAPKSGSTSVLFVYKKADPSKLYRLDLGPTPASGGKAVWHHNQKGVSRVAGLAFARNHAQSGVATAHGRAISIFRWGGRAMFAAGLGVSGYEIYHADDRPRQVVKEVAGLSGAIAGGYVGGKVGIKVGAAYAVVVGQLGPQVAAPEEVVSVPVGATVGAVVGSFIGSVAGFAIGTETAETVYDVAFKPLEKEEWVVACESYEPVTSDTSPRQNWFEE